MKIDLYHYSFAKYDVLKTLELQGRVTDADRRAAVKDSIMRRGVPPGYYYQHISFFHEKIPLDIYKYFPKDHPLWIKGNTFYEYKVDLRKIKRFKYHIVEVPSVIDAMYDDNVDYDEFWDIYEREYKNNYIGASVDDYLKSISMIPGDLPYYFSRAKKLNKGNPDFQYSYAAGVPHVMLYPESGFVEYDSVKRIKLI